MKRREVNLIEVSSGWLWAERGVTYKSLTAAKRVISIEDKKSAKTFGAVSTFLKIHPYTHAGYVVSKSLSLL